MQSESITVNPLNLVTQSSFERVVKKKVKIPITRQPVKDFTSTYLSPKMWPGNQGRLRNTRGSMFPINRWRLNISKYHTNNSYSRIKEKNNLVVDDRLDQSDKVPLIFSDKIDYKTTNNRKMTFCRSIDSKHSSLSKHINATNEFWDKPQTDRPNTTKSDNKILQNLYQKAVRGETISPENFGFQNNFLKRKASCTHERKNKTFNM